jgi:acyl carrier protein
VRSVNQVADECRFCNRQRRSFGFQARLEDEDATFRELGTKKEREMTEVEFYKEVENILEAPSGSITGSELLADLAGWDSLAVLSFLALADEKFEAVLSATQLADCRSVADLVKLFPGKILDGRSMVA